MVAKLIDPEGQVRELTETEYEALRDVLDEREKHEFDAQRQSEQLLEVLNWLKNEPNKESPEWWDDFEMFLRSHLKS